MRDLINDIVILKERVLDTEIYNSKDTIILKRPPKLSGKACVQVLVDFLNQFINADIVPTDLRTCHFFGQDYESVIFLKLVSFGQKNIIWRNKKMLRGVSNGKPNYLVDRLSKLPRNIYHQSQTMGLRTVINNAEVKTICKNETGATTFRPIRSIKQLNNVKFNALK